MPAAPCRARCLLLCGRLGGRPYDNRGHFYTGSFNDFLLNARVKRFTAQAAALATIQSSFTTTGSLLMPVVTDHTLLDPAVPERQEIIYAGKVALARQSARLRQFVVPRYGHCAFTVGGAGARVQPVGAADRRPCSSSLGIDDSRA
jgi:hypothetical protein